MTNSFGTQQCVFYIIMADKQDFSDFPDFCTELRTKTKNAHDKSDVLINLKLAIVLTNKESWGHVLADFYYVFQTIEQCILQYSDCPNVGPLYMKEIQRSDAFVEDLKFYLGANWRQRINPSLQAQRYCDRIVDAASEDPVLLVAYAHSMYLALLAGGQIIRRIVRRTLGLADNNGLAIFDFGGISRKEVKEQFMYNINCMELSRSQKDSIVKEKMLCFQMNNAIAESIKLKPKSFHRLVYLFVLFVSILILLLFVILKIFII